MNESTKRGVSAGVALILLGAGLYFLQSAGGLGRGIFTVLVGGALVTGYLFWRSHFMLTSGCILLSLGLGSIGQRSFFALDRTNWVPLGLGFLAIFVIALLYEKKAHWWPLIPGGLLILLGFKNAWIQFRQLLGLGWPMILVVAGLILVVITILKGRRSASTE